MVLATQSITTDRFVGRKDELKALHGHLAAKQRLVTVLGPGGTGKTRLAVQFASEIKPRLSGGVWFCDLGEATTSTEVLSAVAAGLGVHLGERNPIDQLGRAIRGRGQGLFVFDNFEQVINLAAETLGRWSLLAPSALFMVTSRRALRLEGEHLVPIGPMPTDDAVELFRRRRNRISKMSEADSANQTLLSAIVEDLECRPLAIELAAASMPGMGLEALAEQLKASPDEQDVLGRTIHWSWTLLDPAEQLALLQSAVFVGGFALESAEAVIDLSPLEDDPDVLDAVESLADHNLVRIMEPTPGRKRCRLYETVRVFALHKMKDPHGLALPSSEDPLTGPLGWDRLAHRHASHFALMGDDEWMAGLRQHGGGEKRHALLYDIRNLLAGTEAAIKANDAGSAAGCALAALAHFEIAGPVASGVELARRALSLGGVRPEPRVRLQIARGRLLDLSGAAEEAEATLEQAARTAWMVGLRRDSARAQSELGTHCRNQGRNDEAEDHFVHALGIQRRLDDPTGLALTLSRLGNLLTLDRDPERVARGLGHYTEALAIARQVGDRRNEGRVMSNLGSLHVDHGRVEEAKSHYEAAVQIAREIGDVRGEGIRLANLGGLLTESGDAQGALPHIRRALTLAREIGDHHGEALALTNLGEACMAAGSLDEAEQHLLAGQEAFEELKSPYSGACQVWLAGIRVRQGRTDEARVLLDQAEGLLRDFDPTVYCKLWCSRAELEKTIGLSDAFRHALAQAEQIAMDIDVLDESALGRQLKALRQWSVGAKLGLLDP